MGEELRLKRGDVQTEIVTAPEYLHSPGDLPLRLIKEEGGGKGLPVAVFRPGLQGVGLLGVLLVGVAGLVCLQGGDLPGGGGVVHPPGVSIRLGGILLQPHPHLIGDRDGELVIVRGEKLLIVVGDPLGALSLEHIIAAVHKDFHPSGGHQRQAARPVVLIFRIGGGLLVPDVALHRPDPGEVILIQTDQPCFSPAQARLHAGGGVEQVFLPILPEGLEVGPPAVSSGFKGSASHRAVGIDQADDQTVSLPAGVPSCAEIPVLILLQQIGDGGFGVLLQPLGVGGQGLQNQVLGGLGRGDGGGLGGGGAGLGSGLALTGGQTAAQQGGCQTQAQQGQGRAPFFPLEDVDKAQPQFPG